MIITKIVTGFKNYFILQKEISILKQWKEIRQVKIIFALVTDGHFERESRPNFQKWHCGSSALAFMEVGCVVFRSFDALLLTHP